MIRLNVWLNGIDPSGLQEFVDDLSELLVESGLGNTEEEPLNTVVTVSYPIDLSFVPDDQRGKEFVTRMILDNTVFVTMPGVESEEDEEQPEPGLTDEEITA